jgi:2-oxoglutarate dehydrogenase E1 component
MDRLNYINNANAAFIDSLYEEYKQNPESVDFGWQKFFEGFDFGRGSEAPAVSAETPDHF